MSRCWKSILLAILAVASCASALGAIQPAVHAQEQSDPSALSFSDLNYNDLITSSVRLWACDSLRPSSGPTDLETFSSGDCPMMWSGSGTVINPSGMILTNAHVALDSKQREPVWLLVMRTVDAKSLPQPAFFARAVLYSPAWGARGFDDTLLDLAVIVPTLNLDGTPIQPGEVTMRPLPMADDGAVGIGDGLRNFGYPGIGGDLITMTEGTVSGFEPDESVKELGNAGWIKTDATLGGGISGGTSINEDGLFIGVPTEAGQLETRPLCTDEQGNQIECNIGQINHVRPLPSAFEVLTDIGKGDGLPDGVTPVTQAPTSEQPETPTDGVTIT